MNPVPVPYQGVWQRRLLKCSTGMEDTSTLVLWLQTESLFADLRIPTEASAQMDGFAGVTEVVGNQATWHRDINLRPRGPEEVDTGIMTFTDENHLREDALDGAYFEDWERLEGSAGATWGFHLKGSSKVDQLSKSSSHGLLVGAGDYFMIALDSSAAAASESASSSAANPAAAIHGVSIGFGRIQHGLQPWQVTQSTNPDWRKQCLLLGTAMSAPDITTAFKTQGRVQIVDSPLQWVIE